MENSFSKLLELDLVKHPDRRQYLKRELCHSKAGIIRSSQPFEVCESMHLMAISGPFEIATICKGEGEYLQEQVPKTGQQQRRDVTRNVVCCVSVGPRKDDEKSEKVFVTH